MTVNFHICSNKKKNRCLNSATKICKHKKWKIKYTLNSQVVEMGKLKKSKYAFNGEKKGTIKYPDSLNIYLFTNGN